MTNIEDALKYFFRFKPNVSDAYRELGLAFKRQPSNSFTHVKFKDDQLGVYGIADFYTVDSKGATFVEYAVDREIRRDGPELPGVLKMLTDCEHRYYGMKLNCLALLSGMRIKSLIIRDSYNNETITILHRPDLALLFLQEYLRLTTENPKPKRIELVQPVQLIPPQVQTGLFAA